MADAEPLDEVIADGAPYWQALNAPDDRRNVDAPTGAPTGRLDFGITVTVAGTEAEPKRRP